MKLRVLTATDLHQSRNHLVRVAEAAEAAQVDVLALAGDIIGHKPESPILDVASLAQTAHILAHSRVPHIVFVRGNHEHKNWKEFVREWPHSHRPMVALYGTAISFGPLTIVGFPCHTGDESYWCKSLPQQGNSIHGLDGASGRAELDADFNLWLPALLRRTGPPGRTLWLMHECPIVRPLSTYRLHNPRWTAALTRFQPLVTVSGHDHNSPICNGVWHAKLESTTCINVGQDNWEPRFCIIEFEFPQHTPCMPKRIEATVHPEHQRIQIWPQTPN